MLPRSLLEGVLVGEVPGATLCDAGYQHGPCDALREGGESKEARDAPRRCR